MIAPNIRKTLTWVLLALVLKTVSSANILIFHHVASYSHRVASWPLAEALALRGHQVSYISPFYPKQPNPNITELVPTNLAKYIDKYLNTELDVNLRVNRQMAPLPEIFSNIGIGACEALHASPEFHLWLQTTKKIDLVIVDNCCPECGIGLAYKLGAKYIVLGTLTAIPFEYDAYGYSPETSSIPELDEFVPQAPLDFFQRVSNTLISIRWRWTYYHYVQAVDALLRKSLKLHGMPFIGDLVKNTSLVFYTGDVVTDYPRALPPSFVNVAGMHCKESMSPLNPKLESFINSGNNTDDGFIYISLGSLVVSSNLPQNIKQIFFDTIKSYPRLKFLWKWNGEYPKDIPHNLFLAKWFPQADVLAHKRIRGFVTQSGRPSTLEAIFNGVPMITFPILGDQDYNANRVNVMGGNVLLEIGTVTYSEFKEAVRKVAYDSQMRARLRKLQNIFRERPMKPVETAVWWTEYVLQNEDTFHLKPPGSDQYWFQRRLIDVWAFLFMLILIGLVLTVLTVVECFKFSGTILKTGHKFKAL